MFGLSILSQLWQVLCVYEVGTYMSSHFCCYLLTMLMNVVVLHMRQVGCGKLFVFSNNVGIY